MIQTSKTLSIKINLDKPKTSTGIITGTGDLKPYISSDYTLRFPYLEKFTVKENLKAFDENASFFVIYPKVIIQDGLNISDEKHYDNHRVKINILKEINDNGVIFIFGLNNNWQIEYDIIEESEYYETHLIRIKETN